MNEALEILQERGFIQQCTDVEGLSDMLNKGPISFYVGLDPTAGSLHIGHMVPIFAIKHLAAYGHRGILLVGGGTGKIGDPSGKTEMRKILEYEVLDQNVFNIKEQLSRFVSERRANIPHVVFENNGSWLDNLNFIDFMREIGSQFSVNRMLSFEAYKKRMETGLSFLEFTYQLLQSYDFYMLHEKYKTCLQIGGDDQWGNIVAGIDLIRRKTHDEQVYGLTFPLLTRADGKKMGKSEQGALFLSSDLVSPYDFFQYWRNVDDRDVKRFMLIFTFLPIPEIEQIVSGNINEAKERLAFEVTKLIHGLDEAEKAREAARNAFYGTGLSSLMPSIELESKNLPSSIPVTELFTLAKLCTTKSEVRRLIEQGGASINNEKISDVKMQCSLEDLHGVVLRAGKKHVVKIIIT
ncbi:MAG: tyrosine--tRNA ligase [Spirochaetaceae bacterium]|nr:tyrosine--tRNA ligase [Spirochaetaceae bacterium]